MKKILIWAALIAVVVATIVSLAIKVKTLSDDLKCSVSNEKAWISENNGLKSEKQAFQLTISQLTYYNDSLSTKLLDMKQQLKIKDDNLKSMQLMTETYRKQDTIYLRDTLVITKEQSVIIDTCIQDYWNKTCLHLEYPNKLGLSHEYNNEKYVMVHSRKEPIKPKKCKVANWFAKKHTIIEVTVVDKNPNVQTPQQRFVEIIK